MTNKIKTQDKKHMKLHKIKATYALDEKNCNTIMYELENGKFIVSNLSYYEVTNKEALRQLKEIIIKEQL